MDRNRKNTKAKITLLEFITNILVAVLTEIGQIILCPFREIFSPLVSFWKGSRVIAQRVGKEIRKKDTKKKEKKIKERKKEEKDIKKDFLEKIFLRKSLKVNLDPFIQSLEKLITQLSILFTKHQIRFPKINLLKMNIKIKRTKQNKQSKQKEENSNDANEEKHGKKFNFGVFLLGIFFCLFFITIPFEVITWFKSLPKAELLVIEGNRKPTKIVDRNGKLLYEIYVDRKYEPVKLEQIPQFVINATLAVEDTEFYSHNGIRIQSMLRAAKKTLFEGEKQGGSTITQQLVKNVLLTPERTFSRKLKEAVLSLMVETKYSKDQILELYFNNIGYGGVAWGIQTASQKYFGKNVWELDLAEASMLAGLPSAPSAYSPLTDSTLAKQRQRYVLNRMYDLGMITNFELNTALEEELVIVDQKEFMKAPHFVHLVRSELENMYGKRFVEYGGLTVTTTLDLDLQNDVEEIVKEEIARSAYLNLTNGAAVVLDAKNAGILTYVGSVNYYQEGWGAYDVASAYRQPGSSIKPLTYTLALTNGFTSATIIKDSAITYQVAGSKPYSPVNYDGKYHGNVTLRSALANSYNIPAVKLADAVGPDNIVELGKKMGLSGWEADGTYGLSITLGGKEVRLLDLTNAYATFAREGKYKKTTPFLSIVDSKGYEIYEKKEEEALVLSKEVAYLIWHILSDNNARIPAFGSNSSLVIPNYTVAVKTGTTDSKRDNWTIGFTPSYAVGVWVGNNDNTPMNQYLSSGLTGASPIWNRITTKVLEGKSNEVFKMPSDMFTKTDSKCNVTEIFIKGTNIPKSLCVVQDDEDTKDKDKNKDKNEDEN